MGFWDSFVFWFTGRPPAILSQQFPVEPSTFFGLTPAEWTLILLAIVKIAEIIVKKTPDPRDDTWLAKIKSLLSWLGVGCLALMLTGCQPKPAPMPPCPCPQPEQPAKAAIDGPTESPIGLPVVLDGSKSIGQIWDWECNQPHVCTDNGQRLVIVPAKGRHTVTLAVMSASGGKLSRDTIQHVYTVGESPLPGPGPVPVPPTPPTPGPGPLPFPDGKYGLAKFAHDAAMRVNIDHRAADAKKLADAAKNVSSAIAAGTLRTPVGIVSAVVQQFDSALGSHAEEWAGWRREMFVKLNSVFGITSSPSDFQAGLEEIATGLEAVK